MPFFAHEIAIFMKSRICSCIIFLTSGFMYTHVMLILTDQCLLNVIFCMTKTLLNGQSSPEQNFYSPNLSVLFLHVFLISTLPFLFQTL